MAKDTVRRVEKRRAVMFQIKLSEPEAEQLKALAEKHHRRPGDELRHLLAEAIAADTVKT